MLQAKKNLTLLLFITLLICLIPSSVTQAQTSSPTYQIYLPQMSNGLPEQVAPKSTADVATATATRGDVNCDGVANATDALFLLQYEVGMRIAYTQCPLARPDKHVNLRLADVNDDNAHNASDALLILQCTVGIETVFCSSTPPAPLKNVALGKSSTQSSSIYGDEYNESAPRVAVDGYRPQTFSNRATAQTEAESSAWWQTDLGAVYELHSVKITHFIEECCLPEQANLYIFISEQPFESSQFDETIAQAGVTHYRYSSTVEVGGTGRYLRLQLQPSATRRALVLGEVEVMGRMPNAETEPDFRSTVSLRASQYSTGRLSTDAIEKDARAARLEISRPTAVHAIDLLFAFGGSDDPTRASASADDYVLIDESGAEVTDNKISLAAGDFEHSFAIKALHDEHIEVPETLTIWLQETPQYEVAQETSAIQITLRDAEPGITANSRLLFGEMVPEGGAQTTATGLATIQLSNDNSYGIVNASFTQLTSVQTAAHIHARRPGNVGNPSIFDLPNGRVKNRRWQIEAEAHLATDQEVLDALFAGDIYVNAHSTDYPSGEILATLRNTQASLEMQPLPAPEPIEVLTDDALKRDIVRFLTQATFGPTPDSVAEVEALIVTNNGNRIAAYDEWITTQISLTSPSMLEYFNASRTMYLANVPEARDKFSNIANGITPGWFASAVYGKSQLNERVSFALSEIFVVSIEDGSLGIRPWAVADYSDMLRANAFGPYKTLLTDVSTHPAMGFYLSHLKNRMQTVETVAGEEIVRFSPDENYAREIMQLFSIGLVRLHPDGTLKISSDGLPTRTYSQDDISELARVFTGWNFDPSTVHPNHTNNFNWIMHVTKQTDDHPYLWTPMTMWEDNGYSPSHALYERYHDNGSKLVLNETIPAGQTGEQDLAQVMTLLSEHPNTAPFISYRLIQRLVTSNPSRGYIHRVATKFVDTDGDLGEVVRAILLDPEARNLNKINQVTYGKMKEPLVHLTNIMRVVHPQTKLTATHNITTMVQFGLPITETQLYEDDIELVTLNYKRFGRDSDGLYQAPLQAPSVFNWFLPSYAPPGPISGSGLVAPELQHATETNTIAYYNVFSKFLLYNGLLGETPQAGLILPGDSEPAPYINTTYDTARTYEWLGDIYMSTLDEMADDGVAIGNPAYTSPAAVRQAIGAMVDTVDLYVCAGHLQFNATGHPNTDPREIIITGIQDAWDYYDGLINPQHLYTARRERIKDTLLLVSAAPQCMIQR